MHIPPVPLLLDVDTGVDDALALLFATRHPGLDLRAVGCVAGNTGLPHVLRNTLAVLDVAGAGDVPVAAGHATALLGTVPDAGDFHGVDGLLGVRVEQSSRAPWSGHAVELLRRSVEEAGVAPVLCPLGPLTDVAVLLRTHPEVARRLDRVLFMGGSGAGGNITAAAEFNVWADPEAAAVVLSSEARLGMYGLDVFDLVTVGADEVERLLAADHPAPRLAGRLLAAVLARGATTRATLGDAGAVASLTLPDAVGWQRRPVQVDTGQGPGRGQTIVDRRRPVAPDDPSGPVGGASVVEVAETVDARALAAHVVDVLVTGRA